MATTKTLLEMTQDILSEISGDDVNSIFDTEESEQVAGIIASTYRSLMSNQNWPHMRTIFELTASGDDTLPTHMTLPENLKEVTCIRYDIRKNGETRKKFTEMKYLYPDQFLNKLNVRDNTASTVDTITDPTGVELFITNNAAPTYFTSFDDDTIVFDSYDSAIEDTLIGDKTQCTGYVLLTMTIADATVPNLPVDVFSLLMEEALSVCQFRIKEIRDLKAEQEAGRQKRTLSRKAWKVNKQTRYPDYGKKK